jgi:hypothetical protein
MYALPLYDFVIRDDLVNQVRSALRAWESAPASLCLRLPLLISVSLIRGVSRIPGYGCTTPERVGTQNCKSLLTLVNASGRLAALRN